MTTHPQPPAADHHGRDHAHGDAHGHGAAHEHAHGEGLARILELDAVLYRRSLQGTTALVSEASSDLDVRRVLDVGAGTGTGTVALAERFPAADVVAIDVSEQMLARVRDTAAHAGVSSRVTTERADVAADIAVLGLFDVAWAALSLHEVADADRAFANLYTALRAGGVLAVVEMDEPPRLLPDELAGFEERLRGAVLRGRGGFVDHPDWTDRIPGAGFTGLTTRTLTFDDPAPDSGPAGEYAALSLQRFADVARPHLDDADAAVLATLLGDGPDGVRRRGDLRVRGTRTLWVAHHP